MSAIYFHTQYEDAAVRGTERFLMGSSIFDVTWGFLSRFANEENKTQPSPLRKLIKPGHYSLNMRGNNAFCESLRNAFSVCMGDLKFVVDGQEIDPWHIQLNTAIDIGGPELALYARLHGQCEIHAFVEGQNRDWLAGIIERGLDIGLYRKDSGWEKVIELLRSSAEHPVFTSYSVCEQFPNGGVCGWEDDEDGEGWYELSGEEQWERCVKAMREKAGSLELSPTTLQEINFGANYNVFDLIEAANKAFEMKQ